MECNRSITAAQARFELQFSPLAREEVGGVLNASVPREMYGAAVIDGD